MKERPNSCQSCGMPLRKDEDKGTEQDGSRTDLYCAYCYQQGRFTEPEMDEKGMVERAASILSQMYEFPKKDAERFVSDQIHHLLRWSGRIVPTCESCGMPIVQETDAGTESDGTKNLQNCIYCYKNGAYTDPTLTQETMITTHAPMLAKEFNIPLDKATEMVRAWISSLPRWQS